VATSGVLVEFRVLGPLQVLVEGRAVRLALRLNEERLTVAEECVALELELGRHRELTGELAALVRAHPLRERLVGQLMTALYRCSVEDFRPQPAGGMFWLRRNRLVGS
jgi:hypothetical protein